MARKLNEGKAFWDVEVTICEVQKNEKNKIVVKNVAKDGKEFVDVRNYYMDLLGEWKPAKGIAIPKELADEIADIIKGAVKEKLPF